MVFIEFFEKTMEKSMVFIHFFEKIVYYSLWFSSIFFKKPWTIVHGFH